MATSITEAYSKAAEQARRANEERYKQGISIFDEIINRYQPGGQYGQGAMGLYEQGKTKALAEAQQSLVNSGLSNTTVAAGLPMAYEQEVGSQFRLQLEDQRMNALTNAQLGKTEFIQNRTDAYPDANLFANLESQASSSASGSGSRTVNYPTGWFDKPGTGSSWTSPRNVGSTKSSESNWFYGSKAKPGFSPSSALKVYK